jgi:hypothetical protein
MDDLLRNDEQEPLLPAGIEETTDEKSHGVPDAENMLLPYDPNVVVTKREYTDDPEITNIEPLMPIDVPNK